jgi:hypothetical protein
MTPPVPGRKSTFSTDRSTGRFSNSASRTAQSSFSRKLSLANVAVSNSNTFSGTPPVLTFSNTVHTASFGVPLCSRMTGTA